jgi:hypothetical protein
MRSIIAVIIVLSAMGCGASQPGLKNTPVGVTGKVSQGGQPVGNVAVSFHPTDHGYLTNLQVAPDGTFKGELISGTYAYSIAQSIVPDSAQAIGKIAPQYLEPNLQRTVKIEADQEVLIVLD